MRRSICLILLAYSPCLFAQRITHQPAHPSMSSLESVWNGSAPFYGTSSAPAEIGSSVSVAQLQLPSRAIKELQRAQKSFEDGSLQGSVDHLEKALAICPNFAEGHNLLGVRYVQLRQFENALSEFRSATTLNSR